MAATLKEFNAMFHEIALRVSVLIQQTENYYYMNKLMNARLDELGGQTFLLIWRTFGFEIAARLYRLLERDMRNHHLAALAKMLKDDALLVKMLPTYNRTGNRTEAGLKRARNAIIAEIEKLQKSKPFARIEIFRIKFVAHRQPKPTRLDKLPKHMRKDANVEDMKADDVRQLTARIVAVCERIAELIGYTNFGPETIAKLAREDAKHLWEPTPPEDDPLHFLQRQRGKP